MLLVLLACQRPADDVRAYPEALADVAEAPADALRICADVSRAELRQDCVLAGVEVLARDQPDNAALLCASFEPGPARDECAFQVAEKSGEPARCAEAGRFADDCRLHLWSRALRDLVEPGALPGQVEPAALTALPRYGLAETDPRPWSAFYREVLSRKSPLDRASCDAAPSPELRGACRSTALVLYNDRLNMARDRGLVRCEGGPLPSLLRTTPDPDLETLLARRWKEDLCP